MDAGEVFHPTSRPPERRCGVKITTPLSAALLAGAEPLRAAVAGAERELAAVAADEKGLAESAAQIGQLRAGAADDVATANRLAGFQVQHQLQSARCEPGAVKARLTPHVAALQTALENVASPLRDFLAVKHQALLVEIADVLKNYVSRPEEGRALATQTESVRILVHRMANPWNVFDAHARPLPTSQKILTEIGALLDGAEPWRVAA